MAMRVLDLLVPDWKRAERYDCISAKGWKITLLKQVAKAITTNQPDMHLIILLIDERPEEVTDIKEKLLQGQM